MRNVQEISIASGRASLRASLVLPEAPRGLVLLPQAGGVHPGCRHELAARVQEEAGFATLLVNLLSFRDPDSGNMQDNVPLLGERLLDCLAWLRREPLLGHLACGILAAGSAVPAALRASAQRDAQVKALVCRGGLPDLAGAFYLETLSCPTLLLFGAGDTRGQAAGLRCQDKAPRCCRVEIIPGADREFTHPGHFDTAARLASRWLLGHMPFAPAGADAENLPPGRLKP